MAEPTREQIVETEAKHIATQAERDIASAERQKRLSAEGGSPPAAETPPVETPPPAPEPPKEERPSKGLNALLKRERDFQARSAKVKAELERKQAEITARESQVQKQAEELAQFQALARENPAEFAQRLGITAESFAPPAPDQVMTRLQQELTKTREETRRETEALKAELKRRDLEAEKARLTAEQDRQVKEFTDGVNSFIESKADDYELIRTFGRQDLVLQVIGENYQKTGRTLTAKEASDLVEQHLTQEAEKAAATKKISARLTPPQPQPPNPQPPAGIQPPQAQPAPPPTTLSNSLTASSLTGDQNLDRHRRAIAAYRGQQI